MNCPKCGNTLSEGAVFCRNCGTKIENDTANIIKNTDNEQNGNICPHCGKIIGEGATFCRYCGQSISSNASFEKNQEAQKPKPSKKPLVIAGIAVAVVVVLALIMLPFMTRSNRPIGTVAAEPAPTAETQTVSDTPTPDTTDKTDGVYNSDSLNELSEIIDEAVAVVRKSDEDEEAAIKKLDNIDASNLTSADFSNLCLERADIYSKAASDLKTLKEKALQIQGLDKKGSDARDGFFEMVIGTETKLNEMMTFYADFYKYDSLGFPNKSNYDNAARYHEDLYSWYMENKEAIETLTAIPSCVETEWNEYKKSFDMIDDIINKDYDAIMLNDNLRFESAKHLSDRYMVAENKAFDDISAAYNGENDFANAQLAAAFKLAEEIKTYAQMDDNSKSGYEFENNKKNDITLSYDAVDTIYPSLFNTYDAFVVLKTGCYCGTRKIVVEAEIPGFTQKYKQSYSLDSSYKAIHIKPPALTGNIDLTTAKSAQIVITVYEEDGKQLIDSQSFPVTLKSRNDFEWYTDEFGVSTMDNILCFLTPDAKEIDELKRVAISEINNISGGKIDSFVGYQSTGYNHYVGTYIQAAGIMRALYDIGVRYDMAPFSISGSNQRIKLPSEVINNKSGLCIETSLTVASALQNAGMHAFLVLPTGHAQVAVEVWDGEGEGQGEYFLIETTYLTKENNNDEIFRDYANALISDNPDDLKTDWPIAYYSAAEWSNYISQNNVYIIDCNDSIILGLTEFSN